MYKLVSGLAGVTGLAVGAFFFFRTPLEKRRVDCTSTADVIAYIKSKSAHPDRWGQWPDSDKHTAFWVEEFPSFSDDNVSILGDRILRWCALKQEKYGDIPLHFRLCNPVKMFVLSEARDRDRVIPIAAEERMAIRRGTFQF